MKLSKIEIITGMSKLTGLKSVLSRAGVRGMTVVQVLGCGVEKGTKEYEVDENYEMELLPKQQISIVVKTEKVKEIVELIKQELYTGHIGDGKIFVYDITGKEAYHHIRILMSIYNNRPLTILTILCNPYCKPVGIFF